MVLDASALFAYLNNEPGALTVEKALGTSVIISAVNVSEIVAKFNDAGQSEAVIRQRLALLNITIYPFDEEQAYRAGLLRSATRAAGLSFGDRACLALGQHLRLPVLTADRTWAALPLALDVRLIR